MKETSKLIEELLLSFSTAGYTGCATAKGGGEGHLGGASHSKAHPVYSGRTNCPAVHHHRASPERRCYPSSMAMRLWLNLLGEFPSPSCEVCSGYQCQCCALPSVPAGRDHPLECPASGGSC